MKKQKPSHFSHDSYIKGNDIALMQSGPLLLDKIEKAAMEAKDSIYLQTYIFEPDACGKRVLAALQSAARRGVKVYLLIDAFGSAHFKPALAVPLLSAGVHIEWFNRMHWMPSMRFLRRLHQKVLIIDQELAVVGGFNISQDYLGEKPWLDFALLIRGKIIAPILHRCQRLQKQKKSKIFLQPIGNIHARLSCNDFLRGHFQITRSYKKMVRQAQRNIIIMQAYFFPSSGFLWALRRSVHRGVRVQLIVARKSDVPLLKWATDHLYRYLLKYGVELYEWTPSVLHAKVATVDGTWSTVGSYNLNYTSQITNIEMNVDILDKEFAANMQSTLQSLIQKDAERVDSAFFTARTSLWINIRNHIAYIFVKWMALFSLLFSRQKKYTPKKH